MGHEFALEWARNGAISFANCLDSFAFHFDNFNLQFTIILQILDCSVLSVLLSLSLDKSVSPNFSRCDIKPSYQQLCKNVVAC